MRSVHFNLKDRMLLTPVELVNSLKYLLIAILAVFLISGITKNGFSFSTLLYDGLRGNMILITAYISGAFFGPVLLPWLPFRYFAGKGLVIGLLTTSLLIILSKPNFGIWETAGYLAISGAISSFLTMNFTGASTYTSLSGVRKEMRIFVPLQIALMILGVSFIIISKFN